MHISLLFVLSIIVCSIGMQEAAAQDTTRTIRGRTPEGDILWQAELVRDWSDSAYGTPLFVLKDFRLYKELPRPATAQEIVLPRGMVKMLARSLTVEKNTEVRYSWGYDDKGIYLGAQGTLPYGILLLGGAFVLLSLLFGVLLVRSRRREAILRQQTEAARFARQAAFEGQEQERLRVAREVHDGPVQRLHALRMDLAAEGIQRSVRDELSEATRELRRIAEDLRPPALESFGLSLALKELVDKLRERYPHTYFSIEVDAPATLPSSLELTVFRVAQEALNNVVQHAGASRVQVTLATEQKTLLLCIQDDGIGIEAPNGMLLARSGHFGVIGMQERAVLYDGTLVYQLAASGGTIVSLRVPLESAPAFPPPVAA